MILTRAPRMANEGTRNPIANARAMSTPIIVKLPSRDIANYLIAVGACAVYLTDAWRLGAASVAGLRRLPRSTGIVWLAWTQRMHEAEQIIAGDDLLWRPGADGVVRILRPRHEIIERIEARAGELNIALTSHAVVCERALRMAGRLNMIMRDLNDSGALQAFNRSYRLHRLQMNGHARPYPAAFNEFRREVIRFLTSTPKEHMTPAALHVRLRAKFSWYQYFGN
jgi:hypothetical protein